MIKDMYQKAGELHGHYCPGLAIGVRAAAEALQQLNAARESRSLYCIAEGRACYLDGIQSVFGTTWGNGRLEIRDEGRAAFNFFERDHERALRLSCRTWPEGMSRPELAEFILTAPVEQVFEQTVARYQAPVDSHVKS